MPASKAQQKAVHKYTKNNYDSVLVTLKPKGIKDAIKAHAAARGESVNGFIGRAITEAMERDSAESPSDGASLSGSISVPGTPENASEAAQSGEQEGKQE